MVLGSTDVDSEKNEIRCISIHFQVTNSKWIKDLNMNPKTLKLLEGNTGSNLHDVVVKSTA